MSRENRSVVAALSVCVLIAACGGGAPADTSTVASAPPAAGAAQAALLDWPEFGLDPQRSDVSALSTGITASNVAHLRRQRITLPAPWTPPPSTCTG